MATVKRVRTKSGDFRYRVRWTDHGGKDREKWFDAVEKEVAENYARGVETDKSRGEYFDPRGGRVKLNAFWEKWLDERLVKGQPLELSTKVGYANRWARNVRDTLGERELRTIQPDVVRTWYSDLVKRKGSTEAAKTYRNLHACLATAVEDGLRRSNPCVIRGAGQEHAVERPLAETATVFDLADAIEPLYRPILFLVAFAGLRTGEILGLRRRNVDLRAGEVRVVDNDLYVSGHGRVSKGPKSDAGKRTVPIPRVVVDELREHFATAPVGDGLDDYVFVSSRGNPLRPATLSIKWREACEEVGVEPYDRSTGLGLRLYDLRHHALTHAARSGLTTKELMSLAGHGSMVASLRYQHAAEDRVRTAADYFDDVVSKVERPARKSSAKVVDMTKRRKRAG